MNKFREHATSTALGLIGIGAPAEIINHATRNIHPQLIFGCSLIASLVGFAFGTWNMSQAYEEAEGIEE